MDATVLQLAIAKKKELSELPTKIADYTMNGKLNVADATAVQIFLTH